MADATTRRELADRLEGVKKEHLRLATWNRGKDRPARVAFHHDAAQALTEAARLLQEPVAGEVRYAPSRGQTLDEMRDYIRAHPLFQLGDAKLCWVNEGDLYGGRAVLVRSRLDAEGKRGEA